MVGAVSETDCSDPSFSLDAEEEQPLPTDLAPGNEVLVRCDTGKLAVVSRPGPAVDNSQPAADETTPTDKDESGLTAVKPEKVMAKFASDLSMYREMDCKDRLQDSVGKIDAGVEVTLMIVAYWRCGLDDDNLYYKVTYNGGEFWIPHDLLIRSSLTPSSQ